MFIIWGSRTLTKAFGLMSQAFTCSHCNNTHYWKLMRYSRWFTLFFIPIFPFKTTYMQMCPICGSYVELDKAIFMTAAENAREISGASA